MAAPAGMLENHTLCGALVSSSLKTTVLLTPTTTVIADGWKFRLWLSPAPCGMMTVTAPGGEVVIVVEVVVVEDVAVVLDVLLVVEGEVLGTKMRYAAAAISITTITAAITAPVPIPLLLCSSFIALNSPPPTVHLF